MGECLITRRGGEPYKLPTLKSLTNVTVNSGSDATFTVGFSEHGKPADYTYKWYVNGSVVSGATNATYVRSTSSDKGKYNVYCEVTNKAGTVQTNVVELTVNKKPVLNSSYPANKSVDVGDSATFNVTISTAGYPATYTYQWYVNGSAVSGATSSSYTRSNVAKGTHSVYCNVTNKAGTVKSRTATLTANTLKIDNTIELEGYFYEGSSKEEVSSIGPYNLTKYSTVKADVEYTTSGVCVFASSKKNDIENHSAKWWDDQTDGKKKSVSLDVSDLSGEYYIVFAVDAYWNTSGKATFKNITMT